MFIQRSVRLLVHYFEKLLGVVVFSKAQGQVKFDSPRPKGYADFQTLQVQMFLAIQEFILPLKSLVFFT